MQRPRTTVHRGRTRRWILLALPAILAVFVSLAFFRAQRVLRRTTEAAATAHQLPFTLQPLDPAASRAQGPGFEAVFPTTAYTTGAFFDGSLYLAGPAGLTVAGPDDREAQTLRTGLELPVSPIVAIAPARLRGASEPVLLLATAGAGLLLLEPRDKISPALRQLLPAEAGARDLTALLPLATGDLLLGTRHRGVLLFDGTALTPFQFTLAGINPATLQVTSLAAVDASSFLIGSRDNGVFYVHAGTVEQASVSTGLPDEQVESLAVSATHAYVGTAAGAAEFDLAAPSFRPARILGSGFFSHTLALDAGQLLVGTLDQGIQQIALTPKPRLLRASISAEDLPASTQRIDAFLAAPDALYALAEGRLLRRTNAVWTTARSIQAATLTDRNISALAFAPDGTLYVGFFDHGIDLVSPEGTIHHLEDDHLFCINRLVLDPQRQTIAAATANGLVFFDREGTPRQTLTHRDGLISDHVTDIAFTPTGTALATPAGLTFLGPSGTESLYAFQGLVNNHVYALASLPASNQLLAGTLGGLSLLQSNTVRRSFTVANSTLQHNWITALLAVPGNMTGDMNGGMSLAGTYGAGVETLDGEGVFTAIELPPGTPHNLVINPNALFATDTHIYAGTLNHGVLVYSMTSRRWSVVTGGLPSLNVTAFAAHAGQLYVGTENGLVRIPEADLP